MKLKNIAVASALVAGSVFSVQVNATNYYYNSGTLTADVNGMGQPTNYINITTTPTAATIYFQWSAIQSNISLQFLDSSDNILATTGQSASVTLVASSPTANASWTGYASIAKFRIYAMSSGVTITGLQIWDGNLNSSSSSSSSSSTVNLAPNAYALRSVYNIQSAALNAGLSYDCTVFDKEGMCLSTGGRYSTTNSPSASSTSGLLIGSYKYDKNIRLGAWVDQNLSTNNADGVKLGNSKPLLGVFGVWSERNDGLGYEVKVSAGYGEKDLTVTRTSSKEGSAKVNMKGIQSVSSYGIAIDGDWIAAPYAGLKYVSISRGGYTESGSSPLTYDTLRQETTSVVAGVKFTGKIDPQTFAVLSAGVEHDLNHNVGRYSAGSSNTTAFNSDVKKTRPVVSAGVYHDLDKTQRLGLNAVVKQEPFQSTSSTSAMATYTVGF